MAKVKELFTVSILRYGKTVWLNRRYGWSRSRKYAWRMSMNDARTFASQWLSGRIVTFEPAPPKAKYGSHMPVVKPITLQEALNRPQK